MGFFDRIKKNFISEEDKIKQSHLRNYLVIALSGGKVSDEDYNFIENKGMELNLPKTLIYEVFNAGGTVKTYLPTHPFQRNENLCNYILFANRNGEISKEEEKACKMILLSLTDLQQNSLDKVLTEIIEIVTRENIIDGLTYDRIGRAISNEYLNYLTSN